MESVKINLFRNSLSSKSDFFACKKFLHNAKNAPSHFFYGLLDNLVREVSKPNSSFKTLNRQEIFTLLDQYLDRISNMSLVTDQRLTWLEEHDHVDSSLHQLFTKLHLDLSYTLDRCNEVKQLLESPELDSGTKNLARAFVSQFLPECLFKLTRARERDLPGSIASMVKQLGNYKTHDALLKEGLRRKLNSSLQKNKALSENYFQSKKPSRILNFHAINSLPENMPTEIRAKLWRVVYTKTQAKV